MRTIAADGVGRNNGVGRLAGAWSISLGRTYRISVSWPAGEERMTMENQRIESDAPASAPTALRILVVGAGGFIGRSLVRRLAAHGHEVTAAARRAPAVDGIRSISLDVADEESVQAELSRVDAAFYLVHSMDAGKGFADQDLRLARGFARAASAAGLRRIVYLGGLGSGDLSAHLSSRQEVGTVLASTGVKVVELRAAVILGAGSISFEMMRYLVERLPAMVCPRWVKTQIEPLGLQDVLGYLEEALRVAPGIYEIGGAATNYRDLMQIYARVRGLPRRLIVDIPLLTLHLSSYWVDLVTPVDRRVSHSLIGSLGIPVVVADRARTDSAFSVRPGGLEDAVTGALKQQSAAIDEYLLTLPAGLNDGVYVVRHRRRIPSKQARAIAVDLANGGGDLDWYGIVPAWRLRFYVGRLAGEQRRLQRPAAMEAGQRLDWWTIVRWDGSVLVLRADGWKPGDAWLAYQVADGPDPALTLHAAFRPKGTLGFLYWQMLRPIHRWAFLRMAQHRITRVSRGSDITSKKSRPAER